MTLNAEEPSGKRRVPNLRLRLPARERAKSLSTKTSPGAFEASTTEFTCLRRQGMPRPLHSHAFGAVICAEYSCGSRTDR